MARPKLHADAAARQAAYRARNATADIRLKASTMATIDKLAAEFEVPRTEVINSLINFALLNRNWHTVGLFGKRLPRADAGTLEGDAITMEPK